MILLRSSGQAAVTRSLRACCPERSFAHARVLLHVACLAFLCTARAVADRRHVVTMWVRVFRDGGGIACPYASLYAGHHAFVS